MTLRHNGVIIHDDLEINGKTGGSRREPEGTPGQIRFQDTETLSSFGTSGL